MVAIKKREATSLLTSPLLGGGYILSHFRSTIGVVRLNFSVRNGKRWDPHAITTLLPFSPYGASSVPRLCNLKKETIGGNAPRENLLSRLHRQQNRTHIEPARISMLCISLPHPTHATARAVRYKKTFG